MSASALLLAIRDLEDLRKQIGAEEFCRFGYTAQLHQYRIQYMRHKD